MRLKDSQIVKKSFNLAQAICEFGLLSGTVCYRSLILIGVGLVIIAILDIEQGKLAVITMYKYIVVLMYFATLHIMAPSLSAILNMVEK